MPYAGPTDNPMDPWGIPRPASDRQYRWLSTDPRRLSMWLRAYGDIPGYDLVQGASLEDTRKLADQLGLSRRLVDASNRIVYGHNVLAHIPLEEHHRRQREQINEQLDKITQAKDQFLADADGLHGVTPFEEHPEETQDRKQFNTREPGEAPFVGQAGVGKSPMIRRRAPSQAKR